jgi:hypothetical protein
MGTQTPAATGALVRTGARARSRPRKELTKAVAVLEVRHRVRCVALGVDVGVRGHARRAQGGEEVYQLMCLAWGEKPGLPKGPCCLRSIHRHWRRHGVGAGRRAAPRHLPRCFEQQLQALPQTADLRHRLD